MNILAECESNSYMKRLFKQVVYTWTIEKDASCIVYIYGKQQYRQLLAAKNRLENSHFYVSIHCISSNLQEACFKVIVGPSVQRYYWWRDYGQKLYQDMSRNYFLQ